MHKKYQHFDLSQGSISRHILRMAPPMAVAFMAMMIFNIADTWFVSRLGDIPLAAMGFTFPVVMLVHSLVMGLGLGASAVISQAFGKNDRRRIRVLATAGMILALFLALFISVFGLIFMEPLFRVMGARDETLAMTIRYIRIWFYFTPFAVLPMVGNNAIRATGDTLRPSIIMITGAVLNCILDPLLIFGPGPFPALGIEGAAWATGISRGVTFVISLFIMNRFDLLTRKIADVRELFSAWAAITKIAVPATATNLLMPLTNAFITRIIAGFGDYAIAASAAGQRIEMVAYLVPMSMGTALIPLIGQNWGRGNLQRVRAAYIQTNWYGFAYTAICLLASIPLAPIIAPLFSKNPAIIQLITHYIWIILIGSLLNFIVIHTGFAMNAIGKPFQASLLNLIRLMGMVLPMAWIGSRILGIHGVFWGMTTANLIMGATALVWFLKILPATPQGPEPLPDLVCTTPDITAKSAS